MSDVISRQVAISAICSACGKIDCDKMDKCEKLQLPPANCSEFPNSSDTISRAKAIEALKNDMASLDHIIKGMSANDVRLDAYVSQRNQVNYDIYTINNLPPAQPEQLGTNLAEVGTDCISRQAAIDAVNCVMVMKGVRSWKSIVSETVESAKRIMTDNIRDLPPALPEPCEDAVSRKAVAGIYTALWETIGTIMDRDEWDDVCKATANELPPARPQRIKGHWIESNGLNILMKKFIEKGETWRMCDKCGAGFMIGYQHESDKVYHETFHNFCPKCGADMREVTE